MGLFGHHNQQHDDQGQGQGGGSGDMMQAGHSGTENYQGTQSMGPSVCPSITLMCAVC